MKSGGKGSVKILEKHLFSCVQSYCDGRCVAVRDMMYSGIRELREAPECYSSCFCNDPYCSGEGDHSEIFGTVIEPEPPRELCFCKDPSCYGCWAGYWATLPEDTEEWK